MDLLSLWDDGVELVDLLHSPGVHSCTLFKGKLLVFGARNHGLDRVGKYPVVYLDHGDSFAVVNGVLVLCNGREIQITVDGINLIDVSEPKDVDYVHGCHNSVVATTNNGRIYLSYDGFNWSYVRQTLSWGHVAMEVFHDFLFINTGERIVWANAIGYAGYQWYICGQFLVHQDKIYISERNNLHVWQNSTFGFIDQFDSRIEDMVSSEHGIVVLAGDHLHVNGTTIPTEAKSLIVLKDQHVYDRNTLEIVLPHQVWCLRQYDHLGPYRKEMTRVVLLMFLRSKIPFSLFYLLMTMI